MHKSYNAAMLMVVFGAGASYDSAPSLPVLAGYPHQFRPPLSNELFQNRTAFASIASRYPQMLPIVPYLRALGEKSVEEILEELEIEGQNFVKRRAQLLAVRFYLHDLLSECTRQWLTDSGRITNYRTLLDQIAKHYQTEEPIPLVTFNYDMLLEDALGDHGFRNVSITDYIGTSSAFKLFKLHGSVNWWRVVRNSGGSNNIPHEIIEHAANLEITDTFSNNIEGQSGRFVPALAIPVRNKVNFECPTEHLEELQRLIPKVSKILFIGWRGTEQHFLRLLKQSASSLRYCMFVARDRDDAAEIAKRVMEGIGKSYLVNTPLGEGGFTDLVVRRGAEPFLAR